MDATHQGQNTTSSFHGGNLFSGPATSFLSSSHSQSKIASIPAQPSRAKNCAVPSSQNNSTQSKLQESHCPVLHDDGSGDRAKGPAMKFDVANSSPCAVQLNVSDVFQSSSFVQQSQVECPAEDGVVLVS